jgi:transposase InsO family protein
MSYDSADSINEFAEMARLTDAPSAYRAAPSAPADTDTWLADSACTATVCPDRSLVSRYRHLDHPVRFNVAEGGTQIDAIGVGETELRLGDGRTVTVGPVYYAPKASDNLLSVLALLGKGWQMTADAKGGYLARGKDRVPLTLRDRFLHADAVRDGQVAYRIARSSKLEQEHRRLGHIGVHRLLELAKQGLLRFTFDEIRADTFTGADCSTCQSFKAVRAPKGQVLPRAAEDLSMIHIDLAGPFEPSKAGKRWLVVIVDDRSGAVAAVSAERKSEAFDVLKATVTLWERQFGKLVKTIRSDGDSVLDSHDARAWYGKLGIIHQITPRHTPELNGKAERTIRTIKEGTRAMVNSSGLGHAYWDCASEYFAVVLNKSTIDRRGISAWEKITGRKAGLASVREFGSYGYAQLPAAAREKADQGTFVQANGRPCRILGQSINRSGWIVLFDDGSIQHSRDVRPHTGPAPDTSNMSEASIDLEPTVPVVIDSMEGDFVEVPIRIGLAEEEAQGDIGNVSQGLDIVDGEDTGNQELIVEEPMAEVQAGEGLPAEVQTRGTEGNSGATRKRPLPPSRPSIPAPPKRATPAPTTVEFRRIVEGEELGVDEDLDVPSGIIVTNSLIDQLRTKATQSRQRLSKEEQDVWGRWRNYKINKLSQL